MNFREVLVASVAVFLSACGSSPSSDPTSDDRSSFSGPTRPVPGIAIDPSSIRAESYTVIDTISGRTLAEKNSRSQRAVASTQKLLTALCVLRAGPLADPLTVQTSDTLVEPSKIGIKAGETYTRRTLVEALLVRSGNDVAKALARDVSGSEAAFSDLMNRTAYSLGMTSSFFKNPHGLTEPGQFSTAHDLAILAREVTKIPFFRECMRTKEYTFQFPDGRTKVLTNTNKVLKRLPYCTGMKTGYTRASGKCLISSGVLNGRAVIVVCLGSTTSAIWNDSETLLRLFLEGRTS